MAPVIRALMAREGVDTRVVSTGQHKEMLDQVVRLFDIPVHVHLEVMQPSQTLASLTARLLTRIDEMLIAERPDFALVQGDTTTVLAAALACFYRGVPVGHVEAGLRTGNVASPFPEEANRKLASSIVNLHFAPTEVARSHLLSEGVAPETVHVTGNTVIDALQLEVERQKDPAVALTIGRALAGLIGDDWDRVPYVLLTGHRRENFGGGFQQICEAIRQLASRFPQHRLIYPVHLNPQVQEPVHALLSGLPNVTLIPPQDYRQFVALMRHSTLLLTDSGGVQEEAPSLGKPVLVMRDTTERPEGVDAGTVKLVGAHAGRIVEEVTTLLTDPAAYRAMAEARNPYGDGHAAPRVVEHSLAFLAQRAGQR